MRKLIVVLLDAADSALVNKWMDDGSLPTLKNIQEKGIYAKLSSQVNWIVSIPWLVLYTGESPEKVDFPHVLFWNPKTMKTERLSKRTINFTAFWKRFSANGPRSIILDLPFSLQPTPFNGIEVVGWMTHDTILEGLETFPPSLKDSLLSTMREAKRNVEHTGTVTKKEFLTIRDNLNRQTKNIEKLTLSMIKNETWDLLITSIAATHFGGHKLWDMSNVAEPISEEERGEFSDALRQIYMTSDSSLGRIIESAGEDVNVMAFSLHGMVDNTSRSDILPEMLRLILMQSQKITIRKMGIMKRLRELIPVQWRHQITSRLPMKLRDQLSSFWRVGQNDWKTTKAFCLPTSRSGLIRVNQFGREKLGIVLPEEKDSLCELITNGLKTFVDADTREPIIKNIWRAYVDTNDREGYPDLVVDWADTPAASHKSIFSPQFGSILWPTPGRTPDARSGNHRLEGVFFAFGPDIKSGTINDIHITELAPTILTLLGQPVPSEMVGKVLPIIKK